MAVFLALDAPLDLRNESFLPDILEKVKGIKDALALEALLEVRGKISLWLKMFLTVFHLFMWVLSDYGGK